MRPKNEVRRHGCYYNGVERFPLPSVPNEKRLALLGDAEKQIKGNDPSKEVPNHTEVWAPRLSGELGPHAHDDCLEKDKVHDEQVVRCPRGQGIGSFFTRQFLPQRSRAVSRECLLKIVFPLLPAKTVPLRWLFTAETMPLRWRLLTRRTPLGASDLLGSTLLLAPNWLLFSLVP